MLEQGTRPRTSPSRTRTATRSPSAACAASRSSSTSIPKADTPGCTTQACGIRDHRTDYEGTGARVIGVSPDTVAAQRKFAEKNGLDFTLLADEDHAVADLYGVWGEKKMYGKTYMGVARATFLIDPQGKVAKVFPRSRRRRTTRSCSRRSRELDIEHA